MEDMAWHDIAVLGALETPSRARKVSAVSNDVHIQALNEELRDGTITIRKFLLKASHTIVKALNVGLNGKKRRRNV